MIELAALGAVVLAGCSAAAWAIASAIVVVLDLAGLVWTAEREARRHAGEGGTRFSAESRRRLG